MAKKSPIVFRNRAKQSKSLLEGYSKLEDLIRTAGNTSKSAKSRRGLAKVADKLNVVTTLDVLSLITVG